MEVRNGETPLKGNSPVSDPSPLQPPNPGRGGLTPPPAGDFRNGTVSDREVTLVLPWFDLFQGALVGISRRIDNLRRPQVEEPHGGPDDPWEADILGACGELAVARYLDVFWSGQLGNYKARDAGRVQVRTTGHPNGRLILHKSDADAHAFVLVRGSLPTLTLAGWAFARDGKLPKYWSKPKDRWAYWVPKDDLQPMHTLAAAL